MKKKFDHIIMNPPYGNFHLPILKECVEQFIDIDNDGEVVSLQPIRWIQDPLWYYKNNVGAQKMESVLKDKLYNIDIISSIDMSIYFNLSFTMSCGIFHIKKDGKINYYFSRSSIIDKVMKYSKTFFSNVIEYDNSVGYRAIVDNLKASYVQRPHFIFKLYAAYSYNGLRKDGKVWNYNFKGYSNKPEGRIIPFSIKFETENELENFINSIGTKFFRYYMSKIHICIQVYQQYIPFMNDYTEPWTDKRFYEYFNITEDEQEIIEKEISRLEELGNAVLEKRKRRELLKSSR